MKLRLFGRLVIGLIAGYALYVSVMLTYERWSYHRLDEERVFYALYDPLLSPFLVSRTFRATMTLDESFLVPVGALLLSASALISIWTGRKHNKFVTPE